MQARVLKFFIPFVFFATAINAFATQGWAIGIPLAIAWWLIPLLELFIKPNPANLSEAEEEMAKKYRVYDWLLYLVVPVQYTCLYLFLSTWDNNSFTIYEAAGRIAAMGLLCGVFGINVGHELGHRVNRFEQTLAKSLLLTSLYMHFFTEHNKGHHKRVATPDDPSSARYGEMIYLFYFRTIIFSYLSAWHIANLESKKKRRGIFSVHNEMIQFHLIQVCFVILILLLFGWMATIYYLIAAAIGIMLLETVNYIEHYGLQRKRMADGKYERTMPVHSWNSDHIIGRIFLFELSRHSDHHYLASRKYQVLRHHDNTPQMPTGYPGMMILALIPPAWFYVMNKKVNQIQPKSKD